MTGMVMSTRPNRREALTGAAALAAAGLISPAARADNGYAAELAAFTGGRAAGEGAIRIDLPELAENGNTVPLSVAVDPPEGRSVEEILVVATENPKPRMIRFRYSAACIPEASTRVRLAATQEVIAMARLDDGTVLSASRQIKVTIGGCGG